MFSVCVFSVHMMLPSMNKKAASGFKLIQNALEVRRLGVLDVNLANCGLVFSHEIRHESCEEAPGGRRQHFEVVHARLLVVAFGASLPSEKREDGFNGQRAIPKGRRRAAVPLGSPAKRGHEGQGVVDLLLLIYFPQTCGMAEESAHGFVRLLVFEAHPLHQGLFLVSFTSIPYG